MQPYSVKKLKINYLRAFIYGMEKMTIKQFCKKYRISNFRLSQITGAGATSMRRAEEVGWDVIIDGDKVTISSPKYTLKLSDLDG